MEELLVSEFYSLKRTDSMYTCELITHTQAAHSFLADPEKLTPFVPTIETVREKLVVPDVKLVPRRITAEKLYYYHFEKGDEELMDPSERGKSNNRTETKK